MVGIAGKSKGCVTCRRRKIRCDLLKPSCANCAKAGRVCEGYARYPVFLIRTQQGMQPSKHLEEAIARPTGADFSRPSNLISSSPASSAVIDSQLVSLFWDGYVPNQTAFGWKSSTFWLRIAIPLTNSNDVLGLSLSALARIRLGWTSQNETLMASGRNSYSRALFRLQKALGNGYEIWNDEILAAGYALSVYELFEMTMNGSTGWTAHMGGLSYLLEKRGPRRHKANLSHAVMEELRYSLMVQCIMKRTASFMSTPSWLTEPWEGSRKDGLQQVYDQGFAIAAFFEKLSKLAGPLTGSHAAYNKMIEILERFERLCAELEATWLDHRQDCPQIRELVNGVPNFPNLKLASTIITIWTLQILLGIAVREIGTHITSLPDGRCHDVYNRICQKYNQSSTLKLSRSILHSIPYFTAPKMGILAVQKTLFPLRTAMGALRAENAPERKQCLELCNEIANRHGFRFARYQPEVHQQWR